VVQEDARFLVIPIQAFSDQTIEDRYCINFYDLIRQIYTTCFIFDSLP
jgi:hypothetical protein